MCDQIIKSNAKGKIYSTVDTIPYNTVGLILGTSKHLTDGRLNLYYTNRVTAATELFRADKIKFVIVSGDNSRIDYNEPQQIKLDLMKVGINSSKIYLDFAGFRTFDSMVRAKEIFGQDSLTVITQNFHNERAIYIASRLGMHTIGYNAKDVDKASGLKTQIREKLARVKVFIDDLFGTKPKFLGHPINIPDR